jgi:DNA-binding transcriptional LysR family regulator
LACGDDFFANTVAGNAGNLVGFHGGAHRVINDACIVKSSALNKRPKIQSILNLKSTMEPRLQAADLGFFSALAMAGSLSAAAREMRITTAAVSKRLSQMESRLGVPLLNRTTRRMSLTVEGETMLRHARSILAEMADLEQQLGASRSTPSGLLRVNATLGFGRSHIGPLMGRFVRQYPQVDAQLQLSVDPPALSDDAFDVCIRFGPPPDTRVIARKIASNQRLLCAAPAYIAQHGEPKSPADLARWISSVVMDLSWARCETSRGRIPWPQCAGGGRAPRCRASRAVQ